MKRCYWSLSTSEVKYLARFSNKHCSLESRMYYGRDKSISETLLQCNTSLGHSFCLVELNVFHFQDLFLLFCFMLLLFWITGFASVFTQLNHDPWSMFITFVFTSIKENVIISILTFVLILTILWHCWEINDLF